MSGPLTAAAAAVTAAIVAASASPGPPPMQTPQNSAAGTAGTPSNAELPPAEPANAAGTGAAQPTPGAAPGIAKTQKRRVPLMDAQKRELCEIAKAEPTLSHAGIARVFDSRHQIRVERSTVTRIVNRSGEWLDKPLRTPNAKRRMISRWPILEAATFEFIRNVSFDPELRSKLTDERIFTFAKAAALQLGVHDFKASISWLAALKRRHKLPATSKRGEENPKEAYDIWVTSPISESAQVLENFDRLEDVYNLHATVLRYDAGPESLSWHPRTRPPRASLARSHIPSLMDLSSGHRSTIADNFLSEISGISSGDPLHGASTLHHSANVATDDDAAQAAGGSGVARSIRDIMNPENSLMGNICQASAYMQDARSWRNSGPHDGDDDDDDEMDRMDAELTANVSDMSVLPGERVGGSAHGVLTGVDRLLGAAGVMPLHAGDGQNGVGAGSFGGGHQNEGSQHAIGQLPGSQFTMPSDLHDSAFGVGRDLASTLQSFVAQSSSLHSNPALFPTAIVGSAEGNTPAANGSFGVSGGVNDAVSGGGGGGGGGDGGSDGDGGGSGGVAVGSGGRDAGIGATCGAPRMSTTEKVPSAPPLTQNAVTTLLCTNAAGTAHVAPWIIGAKGISGPCDHPRRPFPGVDVYYEGTERGWLTSSVIMEWLDWFDSTLDHSVLLVTSLLTTSEVSCISLKYVTVLPVGMWVPRGRSSMFGIGTGTRTPMDAILLKLFRGRYRSLTLDWMLGNIEKGVCLPRLSLRTASEMIVSAWRSISAATVKSAFRASAIVPPRMQNRNRGASGRSIDEDKLLSRLSMELQEKMNRYRTVVTGYLFAQQLGLNGDNLPPKNCATSERLMTIPGETTLVRPSASDAEVVASAVVAKEDGSETGTGLPVPTRGAGSASYAPDGSSAGDGAAGVPRSLPSLNIESRDHLVIAMEKILEFCRRPENNDLNNEELMYNASALHVAFRNAAATEGQAEHGNDVEF